MVVTDPDDSSLNRESHPTPDGGATGGTLMVVVLFNFLNALYF
jgi:hypothetical protein